MRLFAPLLLAFFALSAFADGPDVARTVEKLKADLAAYDKAQGGNTIPIEEGFIALRDARAGAEVTPFLEHNRFGFIAAWVASDIGDPALGPAVLAAFRNCDPAEQADFALYLAFFPTDDARAAIRAALEASKKEAKGRLRAALLRAGDPAIEKEILEGLADKDAGACVTALFVLGESRRPDLLDRVLPLVKDERPLAGVLRSRWGVRITKKTPEGGTSSTTDYPLLKTVGAVALEAAAICVLPTTPPMVAWWYENEIGPRFPQSADGIAFLTAWVEAAGKSAAAKACAPAVAVTAALRHLRAQEGQGDDRFRITGVVFGKNWEIRYRSGGPMATEANGEEKSVVVGADGVVTAK